MQFAGVGRMSEQTCSLCALGPKGSPLISSLTIWVYLDVPAATTEDLVLSPSQPSGCSVMT